MIQHGGTSQPGLAENIEALLAAPQPNIKVYVPDIVLTFTLKTINKKIQVSFSLTVLCFVTTDSANQIRIVPISAVVDDPQALEKAVKDAANKAGIPLGKKDATCFELWELVKYIVNNTLADHVSQFIETIPLPSFIKVIDGVNLGNVTVVIIEKFIVATAMVSARMPKLLESDAIPTEGIKEHAAMMHNVAEAAFSKASGSASVMTMQSSVDAVRLPGHGFFLLLTQALFQKLADKYVNINQGSESCSTFLGFIQGCAGWAVRVWHPRVSLQAPHLLVDFNCSADGYAKARAHLPWPIGWTGWVSAGVRGQANPARLTSSFYASGGNTVWMSAGARPFWIDWRPTGNIFWPLTVILAALLEIFTNVTVFIVSLIGARWNIKLANIPSDIPGTGVAATPSIDNTMTNYSGDLAITGTVTFH